MNVELRLARVFAEAHPLEAAQALERLPEGECRELLQRLPLDAAVAVMRQMEASVAATALEEWPTAGIAAALEKMPARNAVRLLERLDAPTRQGVLAGLPAGVAGAARRLMRYAEDSAGALMDPRVKALPRDIAVNEARKRVQREPRNLLYYLYVVDRDDRLVGVVNLRDLLLAQPTAALASVMESAVQSLNVRDTREAIIAHPGWRDFHALPVVDREGVLAGVMRYDTLRQLEADFAAARPPGLLPMGLQLGELYWSAATALLHGLFDAWRPPLEAMREENRNGT